MLMLLQLRQNGRTFMSKLKSIVPYPKISIIIPTYNVEKYISQCFSSILHQTFQDYEIIVVDDCSSDNTTSLIEGYIPYFKNRLRLIKRKKNFGGASVPRNMALKVAKGKYVFFLDGDDIIVNNALELLYNIAEQTQAEVVHVEKYLVPDGDGSVINENTKFHIDSHQLAPFVDKVTLETDNIGNRIERFCQKNFLWWACSKLFLRDFLVKNNIQFAEMISVEDMIFSFKCICCAKKYVRIPNAIYIYRQNPYSMTRNKITVEYQLHRYLTVLLKGTSALFQFTDEHRFFSENPKYKSMIINFFIRTNIGWECGVFIKAPSVQGLDKHIFKEFSDDLYDSSILATYLFSILNTYHIELVSSQKQIIALQEQLNKQIQQLHTPPPFNTR